MWPQHWRTTPRRSTPKVQPRTHTHLLARILHILSHECRTTSCTHTIHTTSCPKSDLFALMCVCACVFVGKMYSCQYCEAVFAQSIELTRHVRTHTGDKPYVCRECGKGFSQANGLSVHLQTFHSESHIQPHPQRWTQLNVLCLSPALSFL